MKPIIAAFLCLQLLTLSATAQETGAPAAMRRVLPPGGQPLVIVDSVVSDLSHFFVSATNIASIDILKDADAAAYGAKGKYGVIIIHTKQNAGVLDMTGLLDAYRVPQHQRALRVCVDNVLVSDPARIIADKESIAGVEVITDICWATPASPGPEETYINIITQRSARLLQ
ncbi:MAG: hypothetical protein ABW019_04345 [Chitinophagaceae bacterium]